jgi:FdhE protein
VAAKFLPSLLGRAPALYPEVAHALGDLERLARERPTLRQPATVLAGVFPWLFAEPSSESPPELTKELAATKLAGGVPLLRGVSLGLDCPAAQRRWKGICVVIQRHQGGPAVKALAKALRPGVLDAQEMLDEVLGGRPESISTHADKLGLDTSLVASVLRWSLFPVLSRCRAALFASLAEAHWANGCCPVCGSWPLLGEFRGLEQTRFLRCGLCAASWGFPRLSCPFCGTSDHRQLGYLHVEGEEGKERAATCDACHGYVKMVSSLQELTGPGLLVKDVSTLPLDLAAAERGFLVP